MHISNSVPLQKDRLKIGVKMKLTLKIICVFLIFALLTSYVAATENKDLPTKKEITDFIAGIPVSDNYIITVFNTVKDKQPAWNCDTWVDQNGNQILSLYYVNPNSERGYGSIYFNEFGKETYISGVKFNLVNHYVGESVSEASTPVDTTNTDTTNTDTTNTDTTNTDTTNADTTTSSTEKQSVEKEQLAEYEKQLAEYEERLTKYEDESQSSKYESQSVENMTKTVENVAKTVENVSQTVENVATKVDEEEETKRGIEIRDGIFITVVGGVIVCIIEIFLKKKRGKRSNR